MPNILNNSVLFLIYKRNVLSLFKEKKQKRVIVLRPNTDLSYDTTKGKYSKNVMVGVKHRFVHCFYSLFQEKKTNQEMFLWQSQFTNTCTCMFVTT